jgi:hypothetical protein
MEREKQMGNKTVRKSGCVKGRKLSERRRQSRNVEEAARAERRPQKNTEAEVRQRDGRAGGGSSIFSLTDSPVVRNGRPKAT